MLFIPGSTSPPEGPLDEQELQSRARTGSLPDDAMISVIGGQQWVPLSTLVKKAKEASEPDKFEVKVGEKIVGPVTMDQIQRGIAAGKIPETAIFKGPSDSAWRPVPVVSQAGPVASPPASPEQAGLAPNAAASAPQKKLTKGVLILAAVAGLGVVGLLVVGLAAAFVFRSSAGKESEAAHVNPSVTAADLKLDFSLAPEVKIPRGSRGGLRIPWKDFQTRWSAEAAKFNVPAAWTRNDIRAVGLWTAEATVGPGVTVGVMGAGRETVVIAMVTAQTKEATPSTVFAGLEILRNVVEPELDARKLYEGLGLLAAPTATTRLFETSHGWRLSFGQGNPFAKEKKAELEVHVSGVEKPTLGPDQGFTLNIEMGQVDGQYSAGAFRVVHIPASKGKTFQEAAKVCKGEELELCSATQLSRACGEFKALGSLQSWTASYTSDFSALQVRGGASGCDDVSSGKASEPKPDRVGLCCTPDIASPTRTVTQMPGLWLLRIKMYERGLNLRNRELLKDAFAPELARFYMVEGVSRESAIKSSMDYMTANPNFWSMTERCSFEEEDGVLMVRCLRNVFNGEKGMAVNSVYALNSKRTGLAYVRDPEILRRMSLL